MRSKLAMGGLILGTAWGAYRRLRSPVSLQGSYTNASTRVIIIGGGFGGLSVARGLTRALQGTDDVGVALMDRMNYTMFWPMAPSVIPSNAEVRHVARSLRCVLKPLGVEFFQDEVVGVNFAARKVKTDRVRVVLVNAGGQILRGLDSSLPGTDSQAANNLLGDKFPDQANGSVPIAFRAPSGAKLSDDKYQKPIERVTRTYSKDPAVTQAVDPYEEQGGDQLNKKHTIGYISARFGRMVAAEVDGTRDPEDLDRRRRMVRRARNPASAVPRATRKTKRAPGTRPHRLTDVTSNRLNDRSGASPAA